MTDPAILLGTQADRVGPGAQRARLDEGASDEHTRTGSRDLGRRRQTSTASFGTGARESHDSSAFYSRFRPPNLSNDTSVLHPKDRPVDGVDKLLVGAAERLLADSRFVADNSVALVVTSPPYFVGKDYEEAMGHGHVPAEYDDHLSRLHEIFGLCVNKLEPGGRIAVNVANLGRKPYRSQASDVIEIFEDLGLLLRGEIIWKKAEGMNSSTAWGSFQRPSNPVLRDLTERVIVASKGRFDRAISPLKRREMGLPCDGSITKEEFMIATRDVWDLPTESAGRVGHPAPFPVELPLRLIDLYTYYGDLVLDPFMGSGTTAVAALRVHRNFVGCETDATYAEVAHGRVETELRRLAADAAVAPRVVVSAPRARSASVEREPKHPKASVRALRDGEKMAVVAESILKECGFSGVSLDKLKLKCGVVVDIAARSVDGATWHFDLTGTISGERDGLRRSDTVWRALGRAAARRLDSGAADPDGTPIPYVLLSTSLPESGEALRALRTCQRPDVGLDRPVYDAICILSASSVERLTEYAKLGLKAEVLPIGAAGS